MAVCWSGRHHFAHAPGTKSLTSGDGYVLDMFMNAAPATPDSPPERAPRVTDGLVGLVRRLAAFGRELLETLQRGNTGFPPLPVVRNFGTISLALVIARITRGLLIAQALEDRLLRRRGPRPEPVTRKAPAEPRAPRGPRPPPADEEAELRGKLPSAEEIARRIRRKPIGAVIVDICRDLGIRPDHPDWQQIKMAIIMQCGNLVRLLLHWLRPTREVMAIVALEEAVAWASQPVPPDPRPP